MKYHYERVPAMYKFFNVLLILSLLGVWVFAGMFIREKNIEMKQVDMLVKQIQTVTPPPSSLPSKPDETEKSSSNAAIEYEIMSLVCLVLTVVSLIGRNSTKPKGAS
jgi:hypothetical protein